MGELLATFRNRDFALLWSGGLISMTGDWMLLVALPIYVYRATGSALATGAMFAAGLLPNVLLGSVAGVFVDRWDRKKTMVAANALMALSILPLLLVPSTGWLWLVYAVAFAQSCFGAFNEPAENSLLPLLVEEGRLVTANSLNVTNNNLARLVGPALAGLVVGRFGLAGVVVADVASYLAAAALVSLISAPASPDRVGEATPPKPSGGVAAPFLAVWREWAEGLRLMATGRVVLTVLLVGAVTGLGEGVFAALFPPFVGVALGGGALELGWLMSAQAVGGLLGGVAVGSLAGRLPPRLLLGLGALLLGLGDLAIFLYPSFVGGIAPGLALFVLVGVPATAAFAGLQTLLQTSTEDRYRGRAFGALATTQALLMLAGTLLGGALGDAVGIVPVLVVQGVAYVATGTLVLVLLPRDGKRPARGGV
ncbi:MFS transporter [Rubrobacter tropicus]|uniref:MFS transporter n=1 Tax=Rubrobacter tropicus TaxID=2653851 RepID=A0A6G8Q8Q7_9ACTN|nr:MFS transporter [Rubrobacter tropicus]QIN82833.1 MFS transporter [Rubrobacter tropicus]